MFFSPHCCSCASLHNRISLGDARLNSRVTCTISLLWLRWHWFICFRSNCFYQAHAIRPASVHLGDPAGSPDCPWVHVGGGAPPPPKLVVLHGSINFILEHPWPFLLWENTRRIRAQLRRVTLYSLVKDVRDPYTKSAWLKVASFANAGRSI